MTVNNTNISNLIKALNPVKTAEGRIQFSCNNHNALWHLSNIKYEYHTELVPASFRSQMKTPMCWDAVKPGAEGGLALCYFPTCQLSNIL